MYERFTDRARKVLQLANQESQRFNHEYVGTEHVLLGMIKEGSGVAANVLRNLDVDLRKIRNEVEKLVLPGPEVVTMGRLPQTPRAKKLIEYAIEEARNLSHNYVGTDHLLLGLLREQEGTAAQVLINLNLKLEEVREEVLNLLGHGMDAGVAEAGSESSSQDRASHSLIVDPDLLDSEESDDQIERLNQDKEEAVANQDFERAAALRDQADRLKKQKEKLRREWLKRIKRFQNHPIVQSCRLAITHLNSQFSGEVGAEDFEQVEKAREHGLRLRGLLHQLYQRLEKEPNYGLPDDALTKYCLEIPWFEGRSVRQEEIRTSLRWIREGRRVIVVGPPGSGRSTLVRSLAREIFWKSAEADRIPVRLVSLDHCALGDADSYAEGLTEVLAALDGQESHLLALEDLHRCADGTCGSEMTEAWRIGMAECIERRLKFVAWTTPEGCDRLQIVWPGLLCDAVILPLSPLPEYALLDIIHERMDEVARLRQVSFSSEFAESLLHCRRRWMDGSVLSDPGLTLDLLDRVVCHARSAKAGVSAASSEVTKKRSASSKRGRKVPTDTQNGLAIDPADIEAFLKSVSKL
jgi:energy-coupling factor transporter ATP-binding protein EcfA2